METGVLLFLHQLQVVGIDAGSVVALVMYDMPIGDRAVLATISGAMREGLSYIPTATSVALFTDEARPVPTAGRWV